MKPSLCLLSLHWKAAFTHNNTEVNTRDEKNCNFTIQSDTIVQKLPNSASASSNKCTNARPKSTSVSDFTSQFPSVIHGSSRYLTYLRRLCSPSGALHFPTPVHYLFSDTTALNSLRRSLNSTEPAAKAARAPWHTSSSRIRPRRSTYFAGWWTLMDVSKHVT